MEQLRLLTMGLQEPLLEANNGDYSLPGTSIGKLQCKLGRGGEQDVEGLSCQVDGLGDAWLKY